jgi:hypothetical protein
MGRAAQTRVKGPDNGLYPIKPPFRDFASGNKPFGNLQDTPIHRQIVVTGGDNQVGPGHQTIPIDTVMMDERPSGRLDTSYAFGKIRLGQGPHPGTEKGRVIEEFFHRFQAKENFDQPGIMIVK